jgi:RNA polymerase sigma-54 factor
MDMRANLGLGFNQTLNITPQLLQSIRLLQLTSAELEIHVREALERNPLLEGPEALADDHDDASIETVEAESDPSEIEIVESLYSHTGSNSEDDEEGSLESRAVASQSDVRQYVLEQLAFILSNEAEMAAAAWLVDQVDDAGYLEREVGRLGDLLPESIAVSAPRLEEIRQHMLRCDPVGFGAVDLRECLLAQLSVMDCGSPEHTLAMRMVLNHLRLLGEHDHDALAEALNTTTQMVAKAERLILSLNPRPGETHQAEAVQYVLPDVVVRRERSGWKVELNAAVAPKVRVNRLYEGMLGWFVRWRCVMKH